MESNMPGGAIKRSSADSIEVPDDTFRYNIEYLSRYDPTASLATTSF